MENMTAYQQIQPEDRMTIVSIEQQGRSMRAMAVVLVRSASTNSRELTHNAVDAPVYT